MTDGGQSEETRFALLKRDVEELQSWRENWADPKLEKAEDDVRKLQSFQRLVLGIGASVGAAVGFFGDWIRKHLGAS